ncbi:Isopropylmalate dehydrogenase-like domain-containing protein [Aspergillus insuetus]
MSSRTILVLPGDGVGPEVVEEALKVLRVVDQLSAARFNIQTELFGGCSIDAHGVPITEAVLQKAQEADAVLAGAVGGPKWGVSKVRPEDGLLQLRQSLDAYANLRTCRFPSDSLHHLSVLNNPDKVAGVDFTILRENCGGAYFGAKEENDDFASDSWAYSRAEVERISQVAIALATAADPHFAFVNETFERDDAPHVPLSHQLADSAAMLMMKNPRMFNGILLADNTFGDILSDEASVIPGSLGLLPSASLSGVPGGKGVKGFYEPVHGSAPDIAGRGLANPVAAILSVALMLRYSLCLYKEADAVEEAVRRVLDDESRGGLAARTGDIGGKSSTAEVGDAIARVLEDLLSAP